MASANITICACVSRSFISNEKVISVASALKNNGHKVTIVDDLCRIIADEPDQAKQLADGILIACHERAVKAHFNTLIKSDLTLVNMRSLSVQEVLNNWNIAENQNLFIDSELKKEVENLPVADRKDAWYPVIDKTRCTNCGKCNDFCLFGTYTKTGDEIRVVQPHNCKNNCPACARICPSGAIIFPKYEKSPINGGTAIEEEFSKEEMEAMYQKRLEYRLQQNRNRFSLLKKE
jgi:ferredoxin